MKRLSLLILFVVLAMSANAQLKVGILTHKIKILEEEPVLPNGYTMFYTEVGNGSKVRIYYGSNDEANGDRIWEDGVYPASYVKFTGYYCGEITDPTDDLVNIRKGPGTQYAVVDKIWVDEFVVFKKTKTNWYQLYNYCPMEGNPIDFGAKLTGYVHKSRIKMPTISKE